MFWRVCTKSGNTNILERKILKTYCCLHIHKNTIDSYYELLINMHINLLSLIDRNVTVSTYMH